MDFRCWHAYVHVVEFGGAVNVHGMATRSGDLVHADRHGAIVVPIDKIGTMMTAAEALNQREARIIAAARARDAGVETIKAAMRG
jgi:regulator of RNase E activity RraA